MDNRPIGFFDSGLGGLTSVSILKEKLPNEHVIYYGDTARTPYGSKSPDTIRKFSKQIVDYLVSCDVKMIIIACNTVTAMALDMLKEAYPDIPIIGVIEPTARRVVSDGCRNIGIIGTKVTINSDIYSRSIHAMDPEIKTYSLACPALVPLIEEGITSNDIMDLMVKYYMDDFVAENDFDDLILGCTHYPIIADSIKKAYPELRLYNSSAEVVIQAESMMRDADMLAGPSEVRDRFYASDLSDNFIKMTEMLLNCSDAKIELKRLEE